MTDTTKKICIFLILVITAQLTMWGENLKTNESPKKDSTVKTRTVSFSMFIPGIRQMETKQYAKGGLLLGAFLGAVAGTIIFNNKGNNWYDKYSQSTNVEEIVSFREKTEDSFKKRNLFMIGIFSLWLIHIVDLKLFKPKKGGKKKAQGGVKGEIGKNSINFCFYYSF